MKKILLIGGAGFIGSNLVYHFLKDNKFEIYVIEPEKANILRLKEVCDKITILRVDLKDILNIYKILDKYTIEVVIHLVSNMLPSSTLEDYQNEMNDILLPSMNIMRICAKKDVLFVYISSGGAVYGNGKSIFYKETDCLNPISYYGLSKYYMEEAIKFENRYSALRYLILRPSNPYGKGQNLYGRQGFIPVAIGKVLKNETITIWGDGSIIRDYLHIDDLCEYILELITKKINNEIFNIGSGKGHSINNIVDIIKDIVDESIDTNYIESRVFDVNAVILSTEHLHHFIPNKIDKDLYSGISTFYKAELKKFQMQF